MTINKCDDTGNTVLWKLTVKLKPTSIHPINYVLKPVCSLSHMTMSALSTGNDDFFSALYFFSCNYSFKNQIAFLPLHTLKFKIRFGMTQCYPPPSCPPPSTS